MTTTTNDSDRRAPAPVVTDEDVEAGVLSAVAQGFPRCVTDPDVLRLIEEAVR